LNGSLPPDWNNKVSSIDVPTGNLALLFKDQHYQGDELKIKAGLWEATEATGDWNDALSSLIVVKDQPCAMGYDQYNLKGNYIDMCGTNTLPQNWIRRILSMYVPDGKGVQVFQFPDADGPSLTINSGLWNAPDDWAAKISDFNVFTPSS